MLSVKYNVFTNLKKLLINGVFPFVPPGLSNLAFFLVNFSVVLITKITKLIFTPFTFKLSRGTRGNTPNELVKTETRAYT